MAKNYASKLMEMDEDKRREFMKTMDPDMQKYIREQMEEIKKADLEKTRESFLQDLNYFKDVN